MSLSGSYIGPDVTLGEECVLGRNSVLDGKIVLGDRVNIGHGVVIEGHYEIGSFTEIGHYSVLAGSGTIGEKNKIGPHCTIGFPAQHIKAKSSDGRIVIGFGNIIRENTTIHLPFAGIETSIKNESFIMSNCNIEHDCQIGSKVILAIGTKFAGHTVVQDFANLGLGTIVHQYCRIGAYAMVAMGSVVRRDVLPFTMLVADRIPKLNLVGLERNGVSQKDIEGISYIYNRFRFADDFENQSWYGKVIQDFCINSNRGFYYPDADWKSV